MAKESTENRESEETRVVNGPFMLCPVLGTVRYGERDRPAVEPLAVDLVGNDGLPPHAGDGRPVPVRVRWRVATVPEGATDRLFRDQRTTTTWCDLTGRAQTGFRLGTVRGVYAVEATAPRFEDGAGTVFKVYSDGVVFRLLIDPPRGPVPVDRALKLSMRAIDWRSRPVDDAEIHGIFADVWPPSPDAPGFAAKAGRNGRYRLTVRARGAGRRRLAITARRSGHVETLDLDFLPGPVRRLELRQIGTDGPRLPLGTVGLTLRALDRFGNQVSHPEVEWTATSGKVRPIVPGSRGSAAAVLLVGREPVVEVSARVGRRTARLRVHRPDIFFQPVEKDAFTRVGDTFRLWLHVTTPAGGGTLRGLHVRMLGPGSAELTAARAIDPDLPELQVAEGDDGIVDLSLVDMELPLSEEGGELLAGELEYRCLSPEEACFEIESARLTIATSPDHDHPLHEGLDYCRRQKREDHKKKLCLRVCVAAPGGGGKTEQEAYEEQKQEVEKHVRRAQEIFNENVEVCCPLIEIEATYERLPWAEYTAVVGAGGAARTVDVATHDQDAAEDVWPIDAEMRELLKKCRSPKCVSIYFVPTVEGGHHGSWFPVNAATISPGDMPETTGERGSGPGIAVAQYAAVHHNTIVHELGHLLIDLPRGESHGDEHVGDHERVMYKQLPAGRKLTEGECSHIWSNVDKYGGS